MTWNKNTSAKFGGWAQLVIVCLNEVLSQNGGVLPNTRAAWLRILVSLVIAMGVHLASDTSAGHPNGAQTTIEQASQAANQMVLVTAVKEAETGPVVKAGDSKPLTKEQM